MLLLLIGTRLLMVSVRLATGDAFPGYSWFAASGIAALLWPAITFVLLLPQRRPEVVDVDRPI